MPSHYTDDFRELFGGEMPGIAGDASHATLARRDAKALFKLVGRAGLLRNCSTRFTCELDRAEPRQHFSHDGKRPRSNAMNAAIGPEYSTPPGRRHRFMIVPSRPTEAWSVPSPFFIQVQDARSTAGGCLGHRLHPSPPCLEEMLCNVSTVSKPQRDLRAPPRLGNEPARASSLA